MKKPLIGITTKQSVDEENHPTVLQMQSYVDAVMQAGGVPVLIPSMISEDGWDAAYFRLDGILFSGGGDVAIERFAGDSHPRVYEVDPERDSVEIKSAPSCRLKQQTVPRHLPRMSGDECCPRRDALHSHSRSIVRRP